MFFVMLLLVLLLSLLSCYCLETRKDDVDPWKIAYC